MRVTFAILSLPLLSLAACGGGGGAQSLGSIAPPTSIGGTTGGSGSAGTQTSFLDVAAITTFDGVGGFQSVNVDAVTNPNGTTSTFTTYVANASTVSEPSGTIKYSPRDGIFTVVIEDTKANVSRSVNFQDPIHRIDFNPGRAPIADVPNLAGFNYLKVDDSDGSSDTFFYQRPGNVTTYVTLAGFVHYSVPTTGTPYQADHGAMVFGSKTSALQIPTTGSGHFDGDFLATMISSGSRDTTSFGTVLQWINGTSAVDVDFGKSSLTLGLSGKIGETFRNGQAYTDPVNFASGTAFNANGTATLTKLTSGFAGKFLSAYFTANSVRTNVDFAPISATSSTAGASSIDGAFYGPNAVNVGGNFRITGGVPDQRIDILGAFVGAKK